LSTYNPILSNNMSSVIFFLENFTHSILLPFLFPGKRISLS
jgi:hypothetical protein